jgi:hypothetical protein
MRQQASPVQDLPDRGEVGFAPRAAARSIRSVKHAVRMLKREEVEGWKFLVTQTS